jgi:hypothetical protein
MSTLTRDAPPAVREEPVLCAQGLPARDAAAEQIADLAYRYWIERQKSLAPGSDMGDWLRAEAELFARREAAIDEASEESFPASDPPAR